MEREKGGEGGERERERRKRQREGERGRERERCALSAGRMNHRVQSEVPDGRSA